MAKVTAEATLSKADVSATITEATKDTSTAEAADDCPKEVRNMKSCDSSTTINSDGLTTLNGGRWTDQEHDLFIEGYKKFGKDWKRISEFMGFSRSNVQCRSHAQKFFRKKRGFSYAFQDTVTPGPDRKRQARTDSVDDASTDSSSSCSSSPVFSSSHVSKPIARQVEPVQVVYPKPFFPTTSSVLPFRHGINPSNLGMGWGGVAQSSLAPFSRLVHDSLPHHGAPWSMQRQPSNWAAAMLSFTLQQNAAMARNMLSASQQAQQTPPHHISLMPRFY